MSGLSQWWHRQILRHTTTTRLVSVSGWDAWMTELRTRCECGKVWST